MKFLIAWVLPLTIISFCIAAVLLLVLFFVRGIKKIPQGKAMIIFGYFLRKDKEGKKISYKIKTCESAFVFPFLQYYMLLDLQEFNFEVSVCGYAKYDFYADIKLNIKCRICDAENCINRAAERLTGLSQDRIKRVLYQEVEEKISYYIPNLDIYQEENKTKFLNSLETITEKALKNFGVELVSVSLQNNLNV